MSRRYTAKVVKTLWYWWWDRHMDQWNRRREPRNRPTQICQIDFLQRCWGIQWREEGTRHLSGKKYAPGPKLYIYMKERKWNSLSCVWLFVTPWTIYSPWNSPRQNTGMGSCSLLQESQPRKWTQVCCIVGGFFTSWATREAHIYIHIYKSK